MRLLRRRYAFSATAGDRITVRQILTAEDAVDVTERLQAAYANL